MNAHTPFPDAPPADGSDRLDALALVLIEPQLKLLATLAEAGVEIAVALKDQAKGETDVCVAGGDIGNAYSRVSRAVRLTLALQSKLIADLQDRRDARADRAVETADDRADLGADLEYLRKARVERIVERVVEAEHRDGETADRLIIEAGERLDDFDRYDDLLSRPFSEILEVICGDLGVPLDWNALAQEGWARREINSGAPGAPLKALGLAPMPRLPGAPPIPTVADLDAHWFAQQLRDQERGHGSVRRKRRSPPEPETETAHPGEGRGPDPMETPSDQDP